MSEPTASPVVVVPIDELMAHFDQRLGQFFDQLATHLDQALAQMEERLDQRFSKELHTMKIEYLVPVKKDVLDLSDSVQKVDRRLTRSEARFAFPFLVSISL
jgi:hypothetical protein